MNNKLIKIKELIKQLNNASEAYYMHDYPIITDKQYDDLYDELMRLEKETGVILSNSPTQNVGCEVKSKLEKVTHSHPMLSLNKTKSVNDLKMFAGDKDCLLMLKMDGLTILLTYDKGVLVKAETRGNGEIGEDITHNARVFENIPLHIDYKGYLEVEGEAIITYDDFNKINAELTEENKYKNPRNLASGSVRQLDSNIAAKRHLKFIAWKVPFGYDTFLEGFQAIKYLGFDIVPYQEIYKYENDYETCITLLKEQAKELGYPIDGMVITYNDIEYGKSLGATGHHPRHSLAFKFYEDEETTILKDIEWSMGKTGNLTPVAIFEPVELAGTTVERASVHNVSILTALDLHIGDEITVYKANEIIPQIRDNLSKTVEGRYISIPSECPVCGGETKLTRDNDTLVLTCDNPNCKGKLLGQLTHFVSKNAINIDGLSEATLEKLIELGWINAFKDIFKLEDHFTDMVKLDGFGETSVQKLLNAIEQSRNTTLDRFIYSLSIPLIGRTASKDISKACANGSWDNFNTIMSLEEEPFIGLNGFGKEMCKSIRKWWCNNREMFYELSEYFTFETTTTVNGTDNLKNLSGKTFVITGSLNKFSNRDELKTLIESLDGKVSGSISAKTTALINNDINSPSSKNQKAKSMSIEILTEQQFLDSIGY